MLKRLIEFNMIEKKKDKEYRFPYYTLTKYGENVRMRWYAKWMIDELIPDEALLDLVEKIGELWVDIDIKFIKAWERGKKIV